MTPHNGTRLAWFLHRNFDGITFLRGSEDRFRIKADGEIPEHAMNVISEKGFEEDREYNSENHSFRRQ